MSKEQLVDAILEACDKAARAKVDEDPDARHENPDDYYVEPEYSSGQVEFLADVVLDVLYGFGWSMDGEAANGRWALFGEDFSPVCHHGTEVFPIPWGAYHLDARGGVPSFWRVLCQAAVKKGWIDQEAAPALD